MSILFYHVSSFKLGIRHLTCFMFSYYVGILNTLSRQLLRKLKTWVVTIILDWNFLQLFLNSHWRIELEIKSLVNCCIHSVRLSLCSHYLLWILNINLCKIPVGLLINKTSLDFWSMKVHKGFFIYMISIHLRWKEIYDRTILFKVGLLLCYQVGFEIVAVDEIALCFDEMVTTCAYWILSYLQNHTWSNTT